MDAIRRWLKGHGLERLYEVFEREEIDWEALMVLSQSDVNDLGLPVGQRAKLSAALRELQQARN